MPCYTVTTTKLDLKKANIDVMAAAISALGLTVNHIEGRGLVANGIGVNVTWSAENGTVISARDTTWAERLRAQYGKSAIAATATRFGWQTRTINATQFDVIRS
jgi:hypothetical protein